MRRLAAIVLLFAAFAAAFVSAGAGGEGISYRVRAIFDNAAFVVVGEDVKVAGVKVGKIDELQVTKDNKAAVTLAITDPAFQDFRRDATCKVRPQSLIGEEYVDCVPTKVRQAGEALPPALAEVEDGVRLLPVENTGASVDLDLIGETLRRPYRERLSILISEFGTGLAGRGKDLNEVIRRANPALKEVDGVLRLLARQNRTLERLAVDSDTVIAPLARERKHVTGFITNASKVAEATAERRVALQASLRRFPNFLRELRPTMVRLGSLADEMTPVVSDLGDTAPRLNTFLRQLGPFSRAGTTALTRLGAVAEPGIPALKASLPIIKDLRKLNTQLKPVASDVRDVLVSFQKNDGLERLLDYIFFQATAVNGFDTAGHFLRAALIVNTCSEYAAAPVSGCSANFTAAPAARAASAGPISDVMRILTGADPDAVLGKDHARSKTAKAQALEPAATTVPQDLTEPAQAQPESPAPAAATPAQPGTTSKPQPAEQLLDYLFGRDA
jgi:ABC-type transporter Mla subunit MlaD